MLRIAAVSALLSATATFALFDVREAAAEPEVVLGTPLSYNSIGYGTEHPDEISDNSLRANTISEITWDSWGGPTAHGTGTPAWVGSPPKMSLTASDVGMCHGKLAYRVLSLDNNNPQSICEWD